MLSVSSVVSADKFCGGSGGGAKANNDSDSGRLLAEGRIVVEAAEGTFVVSNGVCLSDTRRVVAGRLFVFVDGSEF